MVLLPDSQTEQRIKGQGVSGDQGQSTGKVFPGEIL
jgi:hypothetical protein